MVNGMCVDEIISRFVEKLDDVTPTFVFKAIPTNCRRLFSDFGNEVFILFFHFAAHKILVGCECVVWSLVIPAGGEDGQSIFTA